MKVSYKINYQKCVLQIYWPWKIMGNNIKCNQNTEGQAYDASKLKRPQQAYWHPQPQEVDLKSKSKSLQTRVITKYQLVGLAFFTATPTKLIKMYCTQICHFEGNPITNREYGLLLSSKRSSSLTKIILIEFLQANVKSTYTISSMDTLRKSTEKKH